MERQNSRHALQTPGASPGPLPPPAPSPWSRCSGLTAAAVSALAEALAAECRRTAKSLGLGADAPLPHGNGNERSSLASAAAPAALGCGPAHRSPSEGRVVIEVYKCAGAVNGWQGVPEHVEAFVDVRVDTASAR